MSTRANNGVCLETIGVEELVEETMTAWADADCEGDVKTAKQKLEFFVNLISSVTVLLKLAENIQEIEAIHNAIQQLRDAKDALRMINHQTVYAY